MRFTHTKRGFAMKKIKDYNGSVVRVQRSSLAGPECIWIFTDPKDKTDDRPAPHLTHAQARRVAAALLAFANREDRPNG